MDEFLPINFVHMGVALGENDQKLVKIGVLDENDKLVKIHVYAWSRKRDRHIGNIYSGAEFSSKQVRGLNEARFVRRFEDREQVILWEAENAEVESLLKREKMDSDTGRVSETERILAPLRAQYAAARDQFDGPKMRAIEAHVLMVLKIPLRAIEKKGK